MKSVLLFKMVLRGNKSRIRTILKGFSEMFLKIGFHEIRHFESLWFVFLNAMDRNMSQYQHLFRSTYNFKMNIGPIYKENGILSNTYQTFAIQLILILFN